jgi:hypothetical protein
MWQDAMADLNEQLHVEGIDEEDDGKKSVGDHALVPDLTFP